MTSAEPTDVRLFEAGTGYGDRTDIGVQSAAGPPTAGVVLVERRSEKAQLDRRV
jgi:hypothetical protein